MGTFGRRLSLFASKFITKSISKTTRLSGSVSCDGPTLYYECLVLSSMHVDVSLSDELLLERLIAEMISLWEERCLHRPFRSSWPPGPSSIPLPPTLI